MRAFATLMISGAIVLVAVVSGFSRTVSSGSAMSGFSRTQHADVQRFPQFDNDRATSWRSVIPPHSQSTLHRHDRFRALIALTGGELKNVTSDGQTNGIHLEQGKAYWQEPMPPGVMHKDVNDTDHTIEVVVVELK